MIIELFFKIDHQSIGYVSLREFSTKSVINFQADSSTIGEFSVGFCGVWTCIESNMDVLTAERAFLT
jgi:hypothetical protein